MDVGNKTAFGILLVLVIFSMAGCGRVGHLDERERNNRIVSKAYEMSNQGVYDAAIALFTKALETYPRLSRPHLDLALLLHDRRNDYVRAIYHYTRYLELRPATEKSSMIKDRVVQAERAFAALFAGTGSVSVKQFEALEAANVSLVAKNASLQERIEELEKEIGEAREQERLRFKAAVVGDATVSTPPEAPVQPAEEPKPQPLATLPVENNPASAVPANAGSRPKPGPESLVVPPRDDVGGTRRKPKPKPKPKPPNVETAPPVLRTYTVRRGDSLSKIAYKVYGDATQWRKIQEANGESLGDSVNVKVGQVLVVP